MIDKSREYGLKGQNISAQGNALGKIEKIKTVRDEKIKDAQNFFRTELLIKYPKKQESSYFVQHYNCSLINYITRTISTLRIQPRALPWARISIPFREIKIKSNHTKIAKE